MTWISYELAFVFTDMWFGYRTICKNIGPFSYFLDEKRSSLTFVFYWFSAWTLILSSFWTYIWMICTIWFLTLSESAFWHDYIWSCSNQKFFEFSVIKLWSMETDFSRYAKLYDHFHISEFDILVFGQISKWFFTQFKWWLFESEISNLSAINWWSM